MRPTSESGFTLVEAVMALLVISLALAAVLQLSRLTASDQRRTVAHTLSASNDRSVLREVEKAVLPLQPIYADAFVGTEDKLSCKGDKSCDVAVPEGYRFHYVVDGIEFSNWPTSAGAQETSGSTPSKRLNALIVLDKAGRVAGAIELRVDHPADCQFDMISRACRRSERGDAEASKSLGEES